MGGSLFLENQTKFDRSRRSLSLLGLCCLFNMSSGTNAGLPLQLVTNENTNGRMDLTGLATQLGINAAIAVGVILAFNILRPNHSSEYNLFG